MIRATIILSGTLLFPAVSGECERPITGQTTENKELLNAQSQMVQLYYILQDSGNITEKGQKQSKGQRKRKGEVWNADSEHGIAMALLN